MATYNLAFPDVAIDAILTTAYHLQQAGYIFRGSASDYSGTPTEREWVIAPAGFTGLGLSSAVPQGSIGVCLYTGTAWVGKVINVLTLDSAPTRNSQNGVTSGGVAATLDEIAGGIMATFASLLFDDETAAADLRTKLSYAVKFSVSDVYQTVTHLNILAATTSKAGLLSAADKVKIDSFLTGIRSMQFVDATSSSEQAIKLVEQLKWTVGGVQEVIDSITLLAATSSKAGLLSAADKAYIDALPATLTSLSNSISGALALMQSLVGYYVCDTAAGTAAKTVAATGYSLTNGGCIRIKMTNANTADNVTLNINSTGAKALYYDGAQASSSNSWEAGEVLEVYYDGTQYQCASGGGGEFATGEKVSNVGIANELKDNDDLITSGAVMEETRILENVSQITTFTAGGFINSSDAIMSNGSWYYIKDFDISGYKSLEIKCKNSANAYSILMDSNRNQLKLWQTTASPYITEIDIENEYPTAKYLSVSSETAQNPYVSGIRLSTTPIKTKVANVENAIPPIQTAVNDATYGKQLMFDIPITKETGSINSSGNKVSGNFTVCVNVDISGYDLVVAYGNTYGSAYTCIKDENFNLLSAKQSGRSGTQVIFDIKNEFPTAKYLSATSVGNPNLAVGGIKRSDTISDILFNVSKDYFLLKQNITITQVAGFYRPNRQFISSSTHYGYKSNLIIVKEGLTFLLTSNGTSNTINYIMYDSQMKMVSVVGGHDYTSEHITIPSNVSYIEFFSLDTILMVSCDQFTQGASGGSGGGNILEGKSYVAIGDSFTAPIGSETIVGGLYNGMSKVYPYIIANRNNMLCLNQGVSATVLNGYLLNERYNEIPENVDYITIWYGINDTQHGISIGTVDDEPVSITSESSTTTCGGFNWFFKWLYTNRPLAHIGVIITDFTEAKRREAIIACCQKWGVPYLDLYDPTVPMIRTRGGTKYEHSTDIAPLGYVEVCAEAKSLRTTVFSKNASTNDMHPNNTCHEWQSTFIEAFMRRI